MRINPVLCWLIRAPIVYNVNYNPSVVQIRSNSTMASKNMNLTKPSVRFVDIGANLTDLRYEGYYHGSYKHLPDLDRVLERAKKIGMEKIIITSGCIEEIVEALGICNKFDKNCNFLYTTVGVHPTRCNEFLKNKFYNTDVEYLNALDQIVAENKERIVAIGELGLDYDRSNFCDKETQKKYFEFQLTLAEKHKLPLFLHMRKATQDTFEILSRNKDKWIEGGGVVHSFTDDLESLDLVLNENLYVGVNGCSLKTDENLKVVSKIPLEKLLLETDCPWCGIRPTHSSSKYVKTNFKTVKSPQSMKEDSTLVSRSEPCHILNVAEVSHQVICKDMDFTQFCDRVYDNTMKLFTRLNDVK